MKRWEGTTWMMSPARMYSFTLSTIRCQLGEGPTYDPATDTAWWFDIRESRLFEARVATGEVKSHQLDKMASALARIDAGRQLIFMEDGLYIRSLSNGRLTLYKPLEADNPETRSNDARVHQSGTFWLGTMGRKGEQGAGSIYALRNGEITKLYPDITTPNAICFSPDGAIAYFSDSRKKEIYRVAVDSATGLPRGAPEVLVRDAGPGGPDGAICDADGLIWNASYRGGCINVYSPQGELLRTLNLPARQATCPAFVGPDLSRLLVTSAAQNLDEAARAADPEHGRTFVLDAGVRGRAEPDVKLGP